MRLSTAQLGSSSRQLSTSARCFGRRAKIRPVQEALHEDRSTSGRRRDANVTKMDRFQLAPERYAGTKTNIKKPVEIAYFSYDSDHNLLPFSDASLKYYYPVLFNTHHTDRNRPIDLSIGFDTFRNRSDSPDEHLDGLLDTLEQLERRQGSKLDVDVITWRGMMTKILTASYEDQDGFEMNATCFQDTIFVEENHEHKLARNGQQNSFNRRGGPPAEMFQYWGYKFETLSMLPKPWAEVSRDVIEAREQEPVENYSQYCSIVKTGIGSTSFVIGGEVDGVTDYKPEDPEAPPRWIELKTARAPVSPRDRQIHDKKMLKFWAQSFLLNVPKIVIGYRSRDGFLENLEELDTHKIPGLVQQHGQFRWNGNICINATGAFLQFLKATVRGEGVWRIRRAPGRPEIEIFKVADSGVGDIIKPSFLAWRKELSA